MAASASSVACATAAWPRACRVGVGPNVEHDPGLVHGAPQPVLYTGNLEHDLLQMSGRPLCLAATLEHCEAGQRALSSRTPPFSPPTLRWARSWRLRPLHRRAAARIPQEGFGLANAALALAERIAHPFSLASALLFNGVLHLDCGDPDSALRLFGVAEALAAEQRLGFVVEPRFIRGAVLSAQRGSPVDPTLRISSQRPTVT